MPIDFRDYLDLEAGLHHRLVKAWGAYASKAFAAITEAAAAKDWATAYSLAQELDLTDLAEAQKDYIRASLKTAAIYGGRAAQGTKFSFLASLDFKNTLDKAMSTFLRGVEWNATDAVQTFTTQLIAGMQAEAEGEVVVKADKPRFVKEFVSFKQEGDSMLQLISSLHSSRLSTWGFTAEAEVMGYSEYELSAVLDGRTSEFCRLIHGKKFKVKDARSSIVTILAAENPDDAKTLQPWPKQNKAALEEFRTLSPKELTARGLHIPPFHSMCRTMLVRVGDAPKLEKPKLKRPPPKKKVPVTTPEVNKPVVAPGAPPAPKVKPPSSATVEPDQIVVPPESQLIPEQKVTKETFKQLGINVTDKQVEHWNDYLGVSPIDALSAISGYSPKQIVDGILGKGFRSLVFHQNGDLSLRFRTNVGKGSYSGRMTFNPYSGVLYKDYGDFLKVEKEDALRFFAQLETQQVVLAQSIAADTLITGVGVGQAIAMGRIGYVPMEAAWASTRKDLLDLISEELAKDFEALPKRRQQVIMLLLSSKDPRSFRALADIKGPFIRALLKDVSFEAYLDLTDAAVLSKHASEL